MRVIAGYLKGQQFASPGGHKTHPMSDKMRGALFNILGDIEGLTFLDAFAGSGALAFEAISRGASQVVAIDVDRAAHRSLDENIASLKLKDSVKASKANVGGWSIHNMERKFDILLLDPPYDDLQLPLLQKLINRHLREGGLAVLSYPGSLAVLSYPGTKELPEFMHTKSVENKKYGDSQLIFYRKTKK